jgi:hypothetical protein
VQTNRDGVKADFDWGMEDGYVHSERMQQIEDRLIELYKSEKKSPYSNCFLTKDGLAFFYHLKAAAGL